MIPRNEQFDGGGKRDSKVLESPRALRSRGSLCASRGSLCASRGSLCASRGRSLRSRPRVGACVAGVRGARSPFQSAEDGGRRTTRNPWNRKLASGARGRALVARPTVRGLSIAGRRPRSAGGWGGVRPSRCGAGRLRCCNSFSSAVVPSVSKQATETVALELTTETAVADRIARKPTDEIESGDHQP